jgi:hypothetical protein
MIPHVPENHLEMSLYYRLNDLAEQMLVDGDFFRVEDENPLPDVLAHFIECLQESSTLTDEQVKEAIGKYMYRPSPASLLSWTGYKVNGVTVYD